MPDLVQIRLVTGQQFEVECDLQGSAEDLKAVIRREQASILPGGAAARLRLIYSGRELHGTGALSQAGIVSGTVIHAMATAAPAGASTGTPPSDTVSHAGSRSGAGASGHGSGEQDDDLLYTHGFGRFSSVGLDEEGVRALRANYYQQVSQLQSSMPRHDNETSNQYLVRSEEAWMARQGPLSEFGSNMRPMLIQLAAAETSGQTGRQARLGPMGWVGQGGEDTGAGRADTELSEEDTRQARARERAELLCGFVLGYFLGIFALLWVLFGSNSRAFRTGVLGGMISSLLMTILFQSADTNSSSSDSSSSSSSGSSGTDSQTGMPPPLLRGNSLHIILPPSS